MFAKTAGADQVSSDQPSKPEMEIEASLLTHGYQDWSVHITRTGRAYFHYSNMNPFGLISGEFFLDPDILMSLAKEAQAYQFNELPKEIKPALLPVHAPTYSIEIRLDATRHSVQVFHPAGLDQSAELDRFSAVWDAVWKQFPLKPLGVLTSQSTRTR
ncbi:hypothetical protein [Propionivibrio soli]|uniref:hypothetical protein n=1 Tax=Propionivibrio soli TaxID=2976531 RepID=UPI0021E7D23F|nr:hypothetical protein [Propionivibrio soli]